MLSKTFPSILACAAVAVSSLTAILSNPAHAGSRYGTPPPAVMSQDLTAPWVLQLRIAPPRQHAPGYSTPYQVQIAPPAVYPRRVVKSVKRSRPFQPVIRREATRQRVAPVLQAPAPAPVVATATGDKHQMDPKFEPRIVNYESNKKPGTIIINTDDKFLYLVMGNGKARRYGVGVGRPGFEWTGTHKISRKAEWPTWRPPAEMIAREKKEGRDLPRVVEGGIDNPLGARALYLGSTLYRIHGTNSPWTIGKAVSSGCIRMRNEDVMDLYDRVGVGARVIVS